MTQPELSVAAVIPTYNRVALVTRAIESLLAQTRVPAQIIVVDDGSTDNTAEVVGQYTAPVELVRRPNGGLAAARNTGLAHVRSDLVIFLDSDDALPPHSVARRASILDEMPDFDVVYCDALVLDEAGSELGRFSSVKPALRLTGDVFPLFVLQNPSPVHTYMVRATCFKEVGVFDESLETLEDYDLWLRMADRYRFYYLDEVLADYHTHSEMMTILRHDLMRSNEIKLQTRAVTLPSFERLAPSVQVRVFRDIAAKSIALGDVRAGRSWLRRALRIQPVSPYAYLLFLLSFAGKPLINGVTALRRRVRALRRGKDGVVWF